MKSEPLLKDSDIMFVLDISNSMDFDDKMEQLKMNANYLADSLLKMNTNNRIGVVKFADGNLLVDESKFIFIYKKHLVLSDKFVSVCFQHSNLSEF